MSERINILFEVKTGLKKHSIKRGSYGEGKWFDAAFAKLFWPMVTCFIGVPKFCAVRNKIMSILGLLACVD